MNAIDIHTHGIGGYDTKTTDAEHILKIAEIHSSYGVSYILPTVYPAPIPEMRKNIEAVKKAMEKSSGIIGINLEGPFLNPIRCGALNSSHFLEPEEYHLKELIEGFEDIVKLITIAPELNGALRLIKMADEMGIIVSMGHSDATYSQAYAGFQAGARGITHIFNAMRGIHHREPGISGFGLLNQDIYIETIADPYHLHPETLRLIFKIKNPKRIIIISDSVKGSQIHSKDSTASLLGGSFTVTQSFERLIQMGYDKDVIEGCIFKNPLRYLGISNLI